MQCHARLGQRGSALRWYEMCERTLGHELDMAPVCVETRQVAREIAVRGRRGAGCRLEWQSAELPVRDWLR
jgi:hypothetical protein